MRSLLTLLITRPRLISHFTKPLGPEKHRHNNCRSLEEAGCHIIVWPTFTGVFVLAGSEASLTDAVEGALSVETLPVWGTQLRVVQTLVNICWGQPDQGAGVRSFNMTHQGKKEGGREVDTCQRLVNCCRCLSV